MCTKYLSILTREDEFVKKGFFYVCGISILKLGRYQLDSDDHMGDFNYINLRSYKDRIKLNWFRINEKQVLQLIYLLGIFSCELLLVIRA